MTIPSQIGVLTFHRCINYGSYWQARCLIEGLRTMGYDAVLLDHHSSAVNRREWRCALKPQLPAKSANGNQFRYFVKTRRFLDAFEGLPRSDRFDLDDPGDLGKWDTVIVGSDEVWNLRHPWYGGKTIFYGNGIKARRLVAYAASFGNQYASEPLPPVFVDGLSKFARISVRDANSAIIARKVLGKTPVMALDPCLLFPPAARRSTPNPPNRPFILLYGHGFSEQFKRAVREAAAAGRYRVLSIGYDNDWADEQFIEANPDDFAEVFANASAVATNFFHGCVFALINAKPFVCETSEYRANKVTDLVRMVSAERRLLTEDSDHLQVLDLLQSPLESTIQHRLEVLRMRSRRFLDRAVAS